MKIKRLNENSNTRIKSALFGDVSGKIRTFAIMTAENPMKIKTNAQKNNKFTTSLKANLSIHHIQYVPVDGMYDNKEHSFMLMNLRVEDAMTLSITYLQESFFFGNVSSEPHGGSQISYYRIKPEIQKRLEEAKTQEELQHIIKLLKQNATSNYILVETSDKISSISDAENFFSRHGDFKFSINMKAFESLALKEIKDEEAFNESFEAWRTTKSAAQMRAFAYNGKFINTEEVKKKV